MKKWLSGWQAALRQRWQKRNPRRSEAATLAQHSSSTRAKLSASLHTALAACLGLACGFTFYQLTQRLLHHPYLSVKEVEIVGAERLSRAEILTHLGLFPKTSILSLKVEDLAARLQSHPWIRQAAVARHLPDRLSLTIDEYRPALFVALSQIYVADSEGTLFKLHDTADRLDLVVLTGFEWETAQSVSPRMVKTIQAAIALQHYYEASHADSGILDEIHWDPALGFSMLLRGIRKKSDVLTLALGRNPMATLPQAVAALRVLHNHAQTPVRIWADVQTTPLRVAVEMRP